MIKFQGLVCAEDFFIKNFYGETSSTAEVVASILSSTLILQTRSSTSLIIKKFMKQTSLQDRPWESWNIKITSFTQMSLMQLRKLLSFTKYGWYKFWYFPNRLWLKDFSSIHPPESGIELFELFRKSILDSSNLEA